MDKRNINMAKAMHPTKVFLDIFQRDTVSQYSHQPLVANREQHRKLTFWFLTGDPGNNWV